MLRSPFLWKLYAGYAVLILLSSSIVGLLSARQIERDTLEEIRESLRVRAALLRDTALPSLLGSPAPALQDRVRSLGTEIDTRLTVIRLDGAVLADSREDPSRMDDHSGRPEILTAGSKDFGTAIRFSNTLGTRMMYVALPVREGDRTLGFVRSALPLSTIDERLARLRAVVGVGAGFAAFMALILGFIMARGFAAPISSMTAVAESMSGGDYDQQLPVTRTDEVGKLAQALNRMAGSSRERLERISTDHNKLLTILGGMVEGVVAVDHEERVAHLNAAAAAILRAPRDRSIGRKIWEVSRVPELSEALSATLNEGEETRRKLRLVDRPQDHVVDMRASPLRDGEGRLVGAVVVLHDVTELDRLETVRRDFVANVSHELKTPITAIRGLIETLIDEKTIDPETRDRFLAKISDQSMRLSAQVTDLLTLSSLESDAIPLERKALDLREVVQTSVQPLLARAEKKGIHVEVQIPERPVDILGDEEALLQATSNLLDNALKYTPREGSIGVHLHRDGGKAILEIRDTGIGIEPRHQARIFERFYRVDKARSRELGGTGLGLSIVKHVSRSHDGDVTVESTPGRGSTFRLILPAGSVST